MKTISTIEGYSIEQNDSGEYEVHAPNGVDMWSWETLEEAERCAQKQAGKSPTDSTEVVVKQKEVALPEAEMPQGGELPLPPLPLVALTPTEMRIAQTSLSEWCAAKITVTTAELADAQANLESAKKHKWKSSAFQMLVQRTHGRLVFYQKVKAAIDAGYLVIPNFPIQSFAVRRRTAEGPAPNGPGSQWQHSVPNLDAVALPVGKGHYVNPEPTVYKQSQGHDDKGNELARWFAHSYQALEFPVVIAKPHIIDATQQAMALKIFDRIGLVGGRTAKRGDPIVVGQIFRKNGWQETTLTFFIGWWFNWEML